MVIFTSYTHQLLPPPRRLALRAWKLHTQTSRRCVPCETRFFCVDRAVKSDSAAFTKERHSFSFETENLQVVALEAPGMQ